MQKNGKRNCTYILRCSDDSLYTGWTNDIEKRLAAHNSGKASKYTRTRRPVTLVHIEYFETKEEAMSREYAIKKLSRPEKSRLIRDYEKESVDYLL
ncbi:MAG: GIY-YIG nuclease family protein [Bacillota bacterium]|nr:GIY-YIG nuclease family protein [Bacillota bacterium]